jgi:hypothetical protein
LLKLKLVLHKKNILYSIFVEYHNFSYEHFDVLESK